MEITATGRRNVRSRGSEVWVTELADANGRVIPVDELRVEGDWERREQDGSVVLCSHQHQPARLRWKAKANGPLRLTLVSHPWSGVAQIRFNGVKRTIDLFSDQGIRALELDPANPGNFAADDSGHLDQRVYAARPPSLLTFANPLTLFRDMWFRRHLIWQFALRDLQSRYRGSHLGIIWSFLTPLLMLVVYTIVFGYLFNRSFGSGQEAAGLPSTQESMFVFPLILFTGLIVFNIFSECLNKAPSLVTRNPNYVKKVVFPVEILPVSTLIASLINGLIMLVLFLLGSVLFLHRFCATVLLFPLVLLPVLMLTLGLTWLFASLGVFIRDINNAIGVAVSALFFLSAIFFPIDQFSRRTELIMRMNPMANLVDDARRTLIMGLPPHWPWWVAVTIFSAVIMQVGYVWFMKSKRWFPDVL